MLILIWNYRVAREVGTEGKLGGQATVQGVAGTWKDLTDNVNTMAFNVSIIANVDTTKYLILTAHVVFSSLNKYGPSPRRR